MTSKESAYLQAIYSIMLAKPRCKASIKPGQINISHLTMSRLIYASTILPVPAIPSLVGFFFVQTCVRLRWGGLPFLSPQPVYRGPCSFVTKGGTEGWTYCSDYECSWSITMSRNSIKTDDNLCYDRRRRRRRRRYDEEKWLERKSPRLSSL